MGNAKNLIGCHRLRDELAVTACDASEGATVYLSLKQAREFRAAVSRIVRSMKREHFGKSIGLGVNIKIRDAQTSAASRIQRSESNAN